MWPDRVSNLGPMTYATRPGSHIYSVCKSRDKFGNPLQCIYLYKSLVI